MINLCTEAKQACSSLTCNKICSIEFGASDTLDLILERTEATWPAAASRPTTEAVTLNGSISISSRDIPIQCSSFHPSRLQDSRNRRWRQPNWSVIINSCQLEGEARRRAEKGHRK